MFGRVGEGIDLERDSNLAAELREDQRLVDGTMQFGLHGTGPVDNHHHTVVLAFLHGSILPEDVLVPLIGVHLQRIDHTGLGGLDTLRGIGGFLHLKPLGHGRDHGTILLPELHKIIRRIDTLGTEIGHGRVDKFRIGNGDTLAVGHKDFLAHGDID